MADQTTTPTPTPAEETSAQRMLREAMAALAAAQEAVKAEEKAKADAIAAQVAEIDAALSTITEQIKALDAQKMPLLLQEQELYARRNTLAPPAPVPAAPATPATPATTTKAPKAAKATDAKYLFWKSYQLAYKGQPETASHTQAVLADICAKHNISQPVPDVATLSRVRDILMRTTR